MNRDDMTAEQIKSHWLEIKHQVREHNKTTGAYTTSTVDYWLEWLDAKEVLPPTAQEVLTWINDMEYEIGHVIDSELPSEWIPND